MLSRITATRVAAVRVAAVRVAGTHVFVEGALRACARGSLLLLLLGGLGTALAAQLAREPVWVDSTTVASASGASVAVSGDRALIVYEHDGQISSVRSSDRSVSWSAPVRVDTDPTASFKFAGRNSGALPLALFDQRAHTLWRDTTSGDADLCYSRSLDGGATWSVELMLDEGPTPPGSPVRDYAFQAIELGGTDRIHVLFSIEPASAGPEDLYLVSSLDAGLTFSSALSVSSANQTGADVDQISLAVDGSTLHCAWVDDRNGADDVFYRRSLDGGLTFAGSEIKVDATGPAGGDAEDGVKVIASGSLVAVGWMEEVGGSRERALVAVSTDGGATFGLPVRVGGYTPNVDDVDELTLAEEDGILYAAWADDRNGMQSIYVSRSVDSGQTWSTDFEASNDGGGTPRLVASPGFLAVTWVGSGIPALSEAGFSRASRDDGVSWTPIVEITANSGDVDLLEPVIDPVYGNLVAAWLADDFMAPFGNDVFAGGFRPQTQSPVGWVSGPTTAHFNLSNFSGAEPFVWILGADSRGSFAPGVGGDPRSTGLAFDATMQFTLEFSNLFVGSLASDGTGSTPSFPMDLPPGTSIYTMAISLDLGPIRTAELTDVIRLSL